MMAMHSYHAAQENYDERQVLHDGCQECLARSKNPALFFRHAESSTFEKAWRRAYNLESQEGDRNSVGEVSQAEKPILDILWAIQIEFQRRGLSLNGDVPLFVNLTGREVLEALGPLGGER